MPTTHLRRKPTTVPVPPPEPQPPTPAEPPLPRGRFTDWIALLFWITGFLILVGLVLVDTVFGFVQHLWAG
jgi:hypothetical protein